SKSTVTPFELFTVKIFRADGETARSRASASQTTSPTLPSFGSTARAVNTPVQSVLRKPAVYRYVSLCSTAELVAADVDELSTRATIVSSMRLSRSVNSAEFWALKKPPRPFTAACRSSSERAVTLVPLLLTSGSGQSMALPLVRAAKASSGGTFVGTPRPTPKVTMCCQNAGSSAEVGTLLTKLGAR